MNVLVAGDFTPCKRIAKMIQEGDYCFFDEVRSRTRQADYSIVNLESPIVIGDAMPIIKTGPNLKCEKNTIIAIRNAGFNCVTLANNHFYDYGEQGVLDTIHSCNEANVDYVGGGVDLTESEKTLYKDIGRECLAIISVCEHEWSIATDNCGGSAPLDIIRVVRRINEAKRKADYILLIVHGGTEHYQLPTPRMQETYRFFIENGADAIVNHHQHCYSGYEVYLGKPIFYGVGNLCFDNNDSGDVLWSSGYVVHIDFTRVSVGFQLFPFIQCGNTPAVRFLTDRADFDASIDKLNRIINNKKALKDAFIEMARSNRSFLMELEPYNNPFFKELRYRGLLPSFVSFTKKRTILELFRCESHRDIMFEVLSRR